MHAGTAPDQGIIVIGIGETETVSCDKLAEAGPMPAEKGVPRIGLIYQTHSPNSPSIDAAILKFDLASKTWSLDEPSTIIVENLNVNLTLAAMRAALKSAP